MAFIDPLSGDVIVRIVYDGPSTAEVAVAVHRLEETISERRRSRPRELADGAAYLLQVRGGRIGERRFGCQVISTSRRPELARQRSYLLGLADSIVYTTAARGSEEDGDRDAIAALLGTRGDDPAVYLTVQVDRDEQPSSPSPESLRTQLGLSDNVSMFVVDGDRGQGIVGVFTHAVRLAVDSAKGPLDEGALDAGGPSPSIEGLDADLRALPEQPAAVEPAPVPTPDRSAPAVEVIDHVVDRAGEGDDELSVNLSPPQRASTTMTWSSGDGQAVLAALADGSVAQRPEPSPWAPIGAIEGWTPGWIVHTREDWFAQDSSGGRQVLTTLTGLHQRLGPLVPRDRTIVMGADDGGWRVWLVTPDVPTLRSQLIDAGLSDDERELAAALVRAVTAVRNVRTHGLAFDLARVTVEGDTVAYLGVDLEWKPPTAGESPVALLQRELTRLNEHQGGVLGHHDTLLRSLERAVGEADRHILHLLVGGTSV
ncbi:hypothetical protein [Haliangium sp.]|uniref:hypothetical protein n=1 Tax=Haliangium sp. TaxID=2663208 RepID=UPI003D09C395